MKNTRTLAMTAVAATVSILVADAVIPRNGAEPMVGLTSQAAAASLERVSLTAGNGRAATYIEARAQDDLAAIGTFRPGFAFWRNIFTIPDGSIAYGSAADGRLLAVFPTKGDWIRDAEWVEASLAGSLDGRTLPRSLDDRRDYVAAILEAKVGPIVHNPTRGRFVSPNAKRYGGFLDEWSAIYERFGVPAEIGLAQGLIESGLNGTRKSEARAIGLCQWLAGNWKYLDRLAPAVIEAGNQTTQAAYCAAYLTVLGTKYGSFIPALSEHHSGGTNVGRTLINGSRLGGEDTREQYFLGADLARDLRRLAHDRYSDIYRTYGPRSYRYAEMVFGNTFNIRQIAETTPQKRIYAMRTTRAIPIAEITRRTRLSADEVRRFNPALVKRVPAGATLYLPKYMKEFGRDVTFWHRPATDKFASVLDDFVRLELAPDQWDRAEATRTLADYERRFRATNTEEGAVMATVLEYVIGENTTSGRREILAEFRESDEIRELFERGLRERDAARVAGAH